jgi:hypothetical protein
MTNKGGRPLQGIQAKTASVAVRTQPWVRDAIKQAAAETGISVTQQIELMILWFVSHTEDIAAINERDAAKYREALAADANARLAKMKQEIDQILDGERDQ